jgi:predicted Zn-dependent protease
MPAFDFRTYWQVFDILGISGEEAERRFGWFIKALRYGTPPHAGFAVSADDTALRLDSAPLADRKPLDTYLRDVWGRGTEITEVREQTVNGFNAAIAMARHREWEYRMAVVRLKPDTVYRVLFASRAIDERREADFAAIVASLRLLPDDEAAALKPYRIRRVAVHRNDTVKKLAARMAIKEDSQERFRLVNGLNDGDRLGKLTHVKIITE